MMGGEKKGVPRKGKLAALPLPSAQGPNPGYSSHTRQTHPAQGTWHCLWPHRGRPGDSSGIGVDAAALVTRGTYCMSQGQEGFPLHPEACRALQVCFLTLCSPESSFTWQGHSSELHLWESHQAPQFSWKALCCTSRAWGKSLARNTQIMQPEGGEEPAHQEKRVPRRFAGES